MKKKRMLSTLVTISMLTAFTAIPTAVNADDSLQLGDYVQMGTYYGEPIVWRVVSFDKISGYDDEGNPIIDSTDTVTEYQEGYLPLMFSDKIVSMKAFDGGLLNGTVVGEYSEAASYRANRGSSYWGDSNIRSWLNSSADKGEVEWLDGNPPIYVDYNQYDKEAGFLNGFTAEELETIEAVTQKSISAYPEWENGEYTTGSECFQYSSSKIAEIEQNYEQAYSEWLTDTMFLLDVKQMSTVYNNSDVLGDDYYIGIASQVAVSGNQVGNYDDKPKKNDPWHTWLRTPNANGKYTVLYVTLDGAVHDSDARYGNMGIRPAFYLSEAAAVSDGAGTEDEPYTVILSEQDNTDEPVTETPEDPIVEVADEPITTEPVIEEPIDILTDGPTVVTAAEVSEDGEIQVYINGEKLSFVQPPVEINDRTLVPLRAIFEALGASVDWDDETWTVTSTLGDTEVKIAIDSNVLTKNGTDIYLDVPAQLYNDYTMVPVRAVAESFGAEVEWDEETLTVYISL